MKKYGCVLICTFLCLTTTLAQKTEVYLIPALHSLHKTNHQYNYDSVRAVVERIRPHLIAVEIRSEDMEEDSAYLKGSYPYEMWMMKYWFPGVVVKGFDWLGTDLEGKPIPPRYWQDVSRIKYLERRLEIDTSFSKKVSDCGLYADERLRILQTASLKNILQSNNAILTREYYNCLQMHLHGSDYEELVQFYIRRNEEMKKRIAAIAQEYAGKRIVVLTGDDHYPYLLEHLRKLQLSIQQP